MVELRGQRNDAPTNSPCSESQDYLVSGSLFHMLRWTGIIVNLWRLLTRLVRIGLRVGCCVHDQMYATVQARRCLQHHYHQ